MLVDTAERSPDRHREAGTTAADPRRPHDGAKVGYKAEPGVVGRISKCSDGWCKIDVANGRGYIRTSDIWGVSDNEVVD